MLIEKRFFDIAKREDEEIKRELEAEKAKMTEEEKLEEKKQHEAEVKEIIRKAEAQMKKHKKIPDSKKIVEFTFLQKAALSVKKMIYGELLNFHLIKCGFWIQHRLNG